MQFLEGRERRIVRRVGAALRVRITRMRSEDVAMAVASVRWQLESWDARVGMMGEDGGRRCRSCHVALVRRRLLGITRWFAKVSRNMAQVARASQARFRLPLRHLVLVWQTHGPVAQLDRATAF